MVAAAASGGLCAAAIAASAYTVNVKVPNSVKPGHTFKVKASGVSGASSKLTVFLSSKSCASTAKAEAGHSSHEIVNKSVIHTYAITKSTKAGSTTGRYHSCAYLTAGSSTRAHATASYFVVIGGY